MDRRLSATEQAIWLLDQAAPLNGNLIAHLRGPLTAAALRGALDAIVRRHPLLAVHVEDADGPRFVSAGTPPIPLRTVARASAATWHAVLEEEIRAPFAPDASPLARAIFIEGTDEHELILCFHHVIGDALGGAFVVRDLLKIAGAILQGESDELTALPERPPLQALLPGEARGVRRFRAMTAFAWRHGATALFRRPRKLQLESGNSSFPDRRTRLLQSELSAGETASIVAACRAAETTMQAALAAALLTAVAEDARLARPATLGCFAAVNLRPRLHPPIGEEMGLYISEATTFHRVGGGDRPLWELAREVKSALDDAIRLGEPYITLPMIGLFVPRGGDRVARFARRVDNAAAIGVTNLGRLPVDEHHGPLTLSNLHGAVGLGVVGPLAACCSTFAGRLTWNLLYVEPLLARERAETIGRRALAHLQRASAAALSESRAPRDAKEAPSTLRR
jgi:hypothetical protein